MGCHSLRMNQNCSEEAYFLLDCKFQTNDKSKGMKTEHNLFSTAKHSITDSTGNSYQSHFPSVVDVSGVKATSLWSPAGCFGRRAATPHLCLFM